MTQEDCLNYGGDWVAYHFNFDNIGDALLSLFCMPWEIMYKNVASNYFLPFFMLYTFGSLCMTALFKSAII